MLDESKSPELHDEADFDLDEDLFDFGESPFAGGYDDDDADLDEIFAAFQEAQLDEPLEELGNLSLPEEEIDVPPAALPERPEPAPKKILEPQAQPPEEVWTPQTAVAPAPSAAHAIPPVQVAVEAPGLSRAVIWMLVAVTALNGLVAAVTLHSSATMRDSVLEVGRHVADTANEIRTGAYEQARVLNDLRVPVVPPDVEDHPAFDRAREEIDRGEFGQARRRLYALLSVVDRLETSRREDIEARAQFLLAEALHLEALERMEGRP